MCAIQPQYCQLISSFWAEAPYREGYKPLYGVVFMAFITLSQEKETTGFTDRDELINERAKVSWNIYTEAMKWLNQYEFVEYTAGINRHKVSSVRLKLQNEIQAAKQPLDIRYQSANDSLESGYQSANDPLSPEPLAHTHERGRAEKDSNNFILNNNNFFQSVSLTHAHTQDRPTTDGPTTDELEEVVSIEGKDYTKQQVFDLWNRKYTSYYRQKLTQPIDNKLSFVEVCEGAYLNIVLNPHVSITTKNGLIRSLEWYVTEIAEGKINLSGERVVTEKPKQDRYGNSKISGSYQPKREPEVDIEAALARQLGGYTSGPGYS